MSMKPTTLEVGNIIKLVLLFKNWMMILAQIGMILNKKHRLKLLLVSKLQNGKYNKIQQINLEILLRLRAL